jgi:hypothetical protein
MCNFDKGQELEFHYKSPPPTVVSLKQRDRWQEDPSKGNAICTAITVKDIEPDVQTEIMTCVEGKSVKTAKVRPETLKFIDPIYFNLRAISLSTITIFNWTHGLDSPADPCPTLRSKTSYSEDEENWFEFSLARTIGLLIEEATHSIYARNAQIDEVVRKVEAGVEEPLGRQLFREAWSQVGTNPRSALVIGVTAAEVGLKRLIATLVPETDWLMQEIQTPPIGKILRKFLLTLPLKARRWDGRPIAPPKQFIGLIEKAVEHRNKVVHTGAPPPRREELAKMLRAIGDLLWYYDVYQGKYWAINYCTLEIIKYSEGQLDSNSAATVA